MVQEEHDYGLHQVKNTVAVELEGRGLFLYTKTGMGMYGIFLSLLFFFFLVLLFLISLLMFIPLVVDTISFFESSGNSLRDGTKYMYSRFFYIVMHRAAE